MTNYGFQRTEFLLDQRRFSSQKVLYVHIMIRTHSIESSTGIQTVSLNRTHIRLNHLTICWKGQSILFLNYKVHIQAAVGYESQSNRNSTDINLPFLCPCFSMIDSKQKASLSLNSFLLACADKQRLL